MGSYSSLIDSVQAYFEACTVGMCACAAEHLIKHVGNCCFLMHRLCVCVFSLARLSEEDERRDSLTDFMCMRG